MTTKEYTPIQGYDGLYAISKDGLVFSYKTNKHLKLFTNPKGYLVVRLYNKNKGKTHVVHRLVWDTFGNIDRRAKKMNIDHIDGNKLNNNIDNLQLLTNRENVSKGYMAKNTTSKYPGVHWHKGANKWQARIRVNKKLMYIGLFKDEEEAYSAYLEARKEWKV